MNKLDTTRQPYSILISFLTTSRDFAWNRLSFKFVLEFHVNCLEFFFYKRFTFIHFNCKFFCYIRFLFVACSCILPRSRIVLFAVIFLFFFRSFSTNNSASALSTKCIVVTRTLFFFFKFYICSLIFSVEVLAFIVGVYVFVVIAVVVDVVCLGDVFVPSIPFDWLR